MNIFSKTGLPPHGICLLWEPGLVWLHAVSDSVIAASYFAIPLALAYLLYKRRDIRFGGMFLLFAIFILACGMTHSMDVWVLWNPDYGIQGVLKAITGAASLLTATLLWILMPRLLAVPTPAQFRHVSRELAAVTESQTNIAERLRRSEETFDLLVDSVTEYSLITLDLGGTITSWNTGARRIVGYDAREIIGVHSSKLYTQKDNDAGLPMLALEKAAQDGRFENVVRHIRRDGTGFMADLVVHPIRSSDGVVTGFVKITRDITDQLQAQRVPEETRAALVQSQKMEAVGQLTGGIAHDFNNMLTAILGALELLERGQDQLSKSGQRMLGVIRRAGEHGAELTRGLLAFARKQTLAPKSTDANLLVSDMAELLRRTLGESVTVETILADDLWPLLIDRNQLESAILNLAVNARDAMPQGGRLIIETSNSQLDQPYASRHNEVVAGDYVLLAVTDTGCGMSPEILSRVFEPFYSTKETGKGTGLGLSQVYGFIKQSGGHVELYSEVGRGTTARLYLPRAREMAEEAEEPAIWEAPELQYGPETILVVEDNENVRSVSTGSVRHLGYTVLEACDAPSAFAVLDESPDIDLLFTDVGLPGMNGKELAEEAVRRRPGLKVVFTSGYTRAAIEELDLLRPGVILLPKPFTLEALARTLRTELDAA